MLLTPSHQLDLLETCIDSLQLLLKYLRVRLLWNLKNQFFCGRCIFLPVLTSKSSFFLHGGPPDVELL